MLYKRLLAVGAWPIILGILAVVVAAATFIPRTRIEAGTDVMLNQADPDLAYYNASRVDWNTTDEYVILCCSRDDWFSDDGLKMLNSLVAEARALPHCRSVTAITTVPLLRIKKPAAFGFPSPTSLDAADFFVDDKKELTPEQRSKRLGAAKSELVEHTQARGNLVSPDGHDISVLAYLDIPRVIEELEPRRNTLLGQKQTPEVLKELAAIEPPYRQGIIDLNMRRKALVDGCRVLAKKWSPTMKEPIKLAGIPIINRNIIEHVDADIRTFGIVSLAAFILMFVVVYRKLRWIVLPIAACIIPIIIVLGLMVATDSRMTVITSNLPVLLFILTLPYAVYLVERYRERRSLYPDEDAPTVVAASARDIWIPCLYSATTTMAGTASLISSGIIPVRTFGIMSTVGMGLTLIVIFLFLASTFRLLRTIPVSNAGAGSGVIAPLRPLVAAVLRAPLVVIACGLAILGVSIWGTSKVTAENKVIDYFWPKSETYVGLSHVDVRLGGTTPLEIILRGDKGHFKSKQGLETLEKVAAFFKDVPETGNVRSFKSLIDEFRKAMPKAKDEGLMGGAITIVGRRAQWICGTCADTRWEGVNDKGEREPRLGDTRQTPCSKCKATASWRVDRVDPGIVGDFCNWDFSVSRVLVRMKETSPTLNRKKILDALAGHLKKPEFTYLAERRPTGVFLLYSNLLQDLLESQKETFVVVLLAIYFMVSICFRNPLLALIVLFPQILPVFIVLGVMGFFHIALDMVTTMIASMAMGVGIDAAIQYTVRYRIELDDCRDIGDAVRRSHATIGRSILIATTIVFAGFLVLGFSKFVPTVWFGLFTGLAMLMGLFASLTILPAFFVLFRYPRPRARKEPEREAKVAPDQE